ncbi:MAG: DMT family transporter [Pseudomonadota bacterium]
MIARRDRLDLPAMAILVVCCASWGLQQVAIKVAIAGVSPVLQAGIRSIGAGVLIWLWMAVRRQPLFERDGTLWWGLAAGVAFAGEFALVYWGLTFTTASRTVIFLYTMPFFTAVGAHWLIPHERLSPPKIVGLCLAFAGVFLAFRDGLTGSADRMLAGDAMALGGAAMWALTTIIVKASRLTAIAPAKTLFYQLAVSAVVLPVVAVFLGESGVGRITPLIAASLLYQAVWVAFVTYLAWFWLIQHYPASRLAAFVFFTPLFGVLAGAALLNEPLTLSLLAALSLVAAGIYLVNRKGRLHPAPEGCQRPADR